MSLIGFKTSSLFYSYNKRNMFDLFVTSHNTKLFEKSFTHSGALIFNKPSSEIKNIGPVMKFEKIWFNFLIEEFLLSERIYDKGFITNKLWMNKDKLRPDISWSWFVVWLTYFMWWIMTTWCLMHPGYYMLCVTCVHCVKFGDFGAFAMCHLYLVIVYLLIFLALLTN